LEHRTIRFDPPQVSTKYAKPVSRPGRAPIFSVCPVIGSNIVWAPA
jgi:hypothetical protein